MVRRSLVAVVDKVCLHYESRFGCNGVEVSLHWETIPICIGRRGWVALGGKAGLHWVTRLDCID